MARPITHINDPDDARIAAYRSIRERDLARRDGLFVAEGKVVLRVLVEAGRFPIHSLLVLENRLAGLEAILARLDPTVPVYAAKREVIDRIAGFHMHRGVLALAVRRAPEPVEALLAPLDGSRLVLGLCGISNHDNVGALFRNAAAFGADAVLLDATSCDPLYRKSVRVSVGAAVKVPFAIADDADALLDALEAHGFSAYALSPRGGLDIAQVRPAARSALLLGSEGEGLPGSVMERAVGLRIPIASDFDSLNVAAASAIALHRFRSAGAASA